MKRFHVHVSVKNLSDSVGFYSKLFGAEPIVTKGDYAKWMLDDPRINFAISDRDGKPGINHLGFQVESEAELMELRHQAERADVATVTEDGAACCHANSDKHWIQDPQGIAWEIFRTLGSIPVFGMPAIQARPTASACCAPAAKPVDVKVAAPCCGPKIATGALAKAKTGRR
ncbi:ArsI/CadI family heavy metal resistance metalloenzyme [Hydrocarboniphaga sp.]|uniref:ArsI/CadI family heavy metal resistance metalloenzyme n=1 Tax=Hydrocarboniphaga sp. TaxID=2033016 RepID=UPI003D0E30E8